MSSPGLAPAMWRRSSHSNTNGGNCLEVADGVPGVVPVRDSKVTGRVLMMRAEAWEAFVRRFSA